MTLSSELEATKNNEKAWAERTQDRNPMRWGIRYLTDALGPIYPKDLVIVAAPTGVGKTQLGTLIAKHNATSSGVNRRVGYIALEAGKNEIQDRITFQFFNEEVSRLGKQFVPFRRYVNGDFPMQGYGDILEYANAMFKSDYENNLFVEYMQDYYTFENLNESIQGMWVRGCRLVILDHVHFMMSPGRETENENLKRIAIELRQLALENEIPVIALAHIRKGNQFSSIVPEHEDIHGSSDLAKIATHIITMAPDRKTGVVNGKWPTYMRITKARDAGHLTRYTARLFYDSRTNSYDNVYSLGKLKSGGREWEQILTGDLPYWARPEPTGLLQ